MRYFWLLLLVVVLGTGCSLIPKNIEFFQKKVKEVPTKTTKHLESEKQLAQAIEDALEKTLNAAIHEDVPTNVITGISDSYTGAKSLSESLGPPRWPLANSLPKLSKVVTSHVAKYDVEIEDYREKVQPNVGKSIEGSGLFSMSYFSYVALWIFGGICLYSAFKIWGFFNPAVAVGGRIVGGVAKRTLVKGVSQVLKGGEFFKTKLKDSNKKAFTKEEILELFRAEQEKSQDEEIQELIKKVTLK